MNAQMSNSIFFADDSRSKDARTGGTDSAAVVGDRDKFVSYGSIAKGASSGRYDGISQGRQILHYFPVPLRQILVAVQRDCRGVTQVRTKDLKSNYRRGKKFHFRGEYELDGASLTLDILDTSGAYQFPAMRALSISTADAFILVFAVDDADTWEEVKNLRQQVINPLLAFSGRLLPANTRGH